MNYNKYNELRIKLNQKDFEGNYKALNAWLYVFSFVGNIGSIFFSYFLVYPGLYKAISMNMTSSIWATIISILFSILFLVIFEIIKRYIVSSFSFNFISNKRKLKLNNVSWLIISTLILALSFYLSLVGSKNLASTSSIRNDIIENQTVVNIDSIKSYYDGQKGIYINDNIALRKFNNDLREKLTNTPVTYISIRKQYQENIDNNIQIIENNQNEINKIENQYLQDISKIESKLNKNIKSNENEDIENIILFIIIAVFCEVIIFAGIYFREYFEFNLYELNKDKFEKIYQKKDRYKLLIKFIYSQGNLDVGDKILSVIKLKELITEKTKIQNPNKFVDEFINDMEQLGVFSVNGKRRNVEMKYEDAISLIENFDDSIRLIENIK